jgi:ATP-dependent helicase/nuclease subunit B
MDFTLNGRPDRIDLLPDGRLHILDYKTGAPPSVPQQRHFDKQLLLLAIMAEHGAFADVGRAEVAKVSYLGLGPSPKAVATDITPEFLGEVWEGLHRLITRYMQPDKGYPARRAMQKEADTGDYDHLSRFGEWDQSTSATRIGVGS